MLLPANEHKRLIVIDFEYASANTPGLEFANHFVSTAAWFWCRCVFCFDVVPEQTEWCYDYHDEKKPYALAPTRYPTVEEQRRFIRSYVEHVAASTPRFSASPMATPTPGQSNSISAFMLDSRGPPAQYAEEEAQRSRAVDDEVEHLMAQTRLWRVANSAQWVAWGIVQATVPDMEEPDERKDIPSDTSSRTATPDAVQSDDQTSAESPRLDKRPEGHFAEALLADDNHLMSPEDSTDHDDDEGEFDYLGYAQERALLFWGDVVSLGLISKDDLPVELLSKLKYIGY